MSHDNRNPVIITEYIENKVIIDYDGELCFEYENIPIVLDYSIDRNIIIIGDYELCLSEFLRGLGTNNPYWKVEWCNK